MKIERIQKILNLKNKLEIFIHTHTTPKQLQFIITNKLFKFEALFKFLFCIPFLKLIEFPLKYSNAQHQYINMQTYTTEFNI